MLKLHTSTPPQSGQSSPIMDINSPSQCNALNVSDEQRCLETATSVNGLFCSFHSKQCQGIWVLSNTASDFNIPNKLQVSIADTSFEQLDLNA